MARSSLPSPHRCWGEDPHDDDCLATQFERSPSCWPRPVVTRGPGRPVDARRQPHQVAPRPHHVVLRDVPNAASPRRLRGLRSDVRVPVQQLLRGGRRPSRTPRAGPAVPSVGGHVDDGWAWVQANGIEAPAYWSRTDDGWMVHTLHGTRSVGVDEPVCHVSRYEADARPLGARDRRPRGAHRHAEGTPAEVVLRRSRFGVVRGHHPSRRVLPDRVRTGDPAVRGLEHRRHRPGRHLRRAGFGNQRQDHRPARRHGVGRASRCMASSATSNTTSA